MSIVNGYKVLPISHLKPTVGFKYLGVIAELFNLSGAIPSNFDKKYKGSRPLYILLRLRRLSILKQGVFDITTVPAVHFVTAVNVVTKEISDPSSCHEVCLLKSSTKVVSILLFQPTVVLNLNHQKGI
jgi:hypothetical protein